MPNMEELRRYAVVDPTEDGLVLEKCLAAAMRYFENAGVPPPQTGKEDPLYDLGVYQLATHYYDNRGVSDDQQSPMPYGVNAIIHQLRL